MSELPPTVEELKSIIEDISKMSRQQRHPNNRWEIARDDNIVKAVVKDFALPVDFSLQYTEDYHQHARIPIYSTAPTKYDPAVQPRLKEQIVVEKTKGRLARCYWNNPQLPDRPDARSPLILDEKLGGRIGDSIGQIWTAHFTDQKGRPKKVVAKFFDPLYYEEEVDGGLTGMTDAFKLASQRLSAEDQAYHQLKPMQGSEIPEYHGVFLAAFPTPGHRTVAPTPPSRNVYLILMEFMTGTELNKFDPRDRSGMPIDKRDAIMNGVMELKSRAEYLGVIHHDFFPRNVILRATEGSDRYPTLVMYDFELAQILSQSLPQAEWDSSEATRAKRAKEMRETGQIVVKYGDWGSEGWFELEEYEQRLSMY